MAAGEEDQEGRSGEVPADLTVLGSGGVALAVAELAAGAHPALVLLHGFAATHADWRPAADRLGSSRRILAPDLRGHGESGWAADGDYSLEATTRDLAAVVDGLARGHAIVGGHSTGAMTALWLAATAPERVAALIAIDVDPLLFGDGLARLPAFDGPERAADVDALASILARAGDRRAPDELRRWLEPRVRRGSDGACTWRQDPRLRPARPAAPRRPRSAAEIEAALARVRAPTLVVRGAASRACTAAAARHFLARVATRHSRLTEVEGAGHDVLVERPDAVAAAIASFLAEIDLPPSRGSRRAQPR